MRHVLYLGASLEPLLAQGTHHRAGESEVHFQRAVGADTRTYRLLLERDPGRALRWLTARPIDVVVIDAREGTGVDEAQAVALLDKLFPVLDPHGMASRERTLVLLDGGAAATRVAFRAGVARVRPPMVMPEPGAILDRIDAWVDEQSGGKIALCLAGGGIEGLLYEVGVMRALDRFLLDRRLCDLDLFFGISAGSFLAALLANGVTPDEIVEGLRSGSRRVPKITRRDLFDPNVSEVLQRGARLMADLVGLGEARNPLSALYRVLPSGAFAGENLRKYFADVFAGPGLSDRFDETRRPVFIGATDQDTSEAVVFGEPGWTDVPIHQAIRASCALSPFYSPQRIGGRWYIDGAFTRTTNMRVAVKHGATMCLLVDPLVPIYSQTAGYVRARGGLFGTMQGLKALINGRFDKAVTSIAEMFPDVSFHLFRPEGEEMRILSGSPMKFLYREEIEQMAYESTVRVIRANRERLQRDFARHGVRFGETTPGPRRDTDPWFGGTMALA